MELCDLYDENRNPLGRTHNRQNPLSHGEFIVAVGIWVFNSKSEVLLTKRHPNKSFAPNLWENTGGHVMAGETSAAAVVRELKEETGIAVSESETRFIGTVKVPPYFGDNYAVSKDVPIEDVLLQDGETIEAKWVSHSKFLEMEQSGELAPSVVKHLAPIRPAFDAAFEGR